MTRLDLGRIGITLNISADQSHLEAAAEFEKLGYSALWLPGGQLDSLDRITEIVRATTAIPVASGIIPADVYAAEAVASRYAELQATAPDRFVVGLGGSQQPRSLQGLNDYLDRLEQAVPPVPVDRRILAALGPRKLDLARDRFAGAITLLVTPEYTAEARRRLGAQATLVVDQMLALDTDAAQARTAARGHLGFLSGVRGYRTNFSRMGFSDGDVADLSDRLVDELVAWGDVDTIAERVAEHFAAGADHVVLGVLNQGEQLAPVEVARQLADRLFG